MPNDDGPWGLLGAIALQEVELGPALRHVEVYTPKGLLTLMWHGDPSAERVVLMAGGAMGGLLGPANGAWHDVGVALATRGIATVRVGYRVNNDLPECVLDLAAAADLASRGGAEQFVSVGHSFGGAVAIGAAIALPKHIVAVATLSTQSAGCENAYMLEGRPLLLLHGDNDKLLPIECSATVQMIAGGGELVVLQGGGHLLREVEDEVRSRLIEWIPAQFG